jgi:hypothetical protein
MARLPGSFVARISVRHAVPLTIVAATLLGRVQPAAAQVFEAVGQRALGMGGAFVAVADDATATYWNPAGLATGPVLDACVARTNVRRLPEAGAAGPGGETAATSLCIAVPALGFSYNKLRATDVTRPFSSTDAVAGDRQDLRTRVAGVSALDTTQVGVTLVQSLLPGVAVGMTVKYVRGHSAFGEEMADVAAPELLERAGKRPRLASATLDADLGVLVGTGSLRGGVAVRNLRAPAFETGSGAVLRLHRQVRAGAAFTPGREALRHAADDGWILALDADLTLTPTSAGDRRMVAAGVERWFAGHRLGLRGGVRANTVGAARPAAAAGVSVGVRSGVLIEAHVTRGGQDADRSWGVGLRVGF